MCVHCHELGQFLFRLTRMYQTCSIFQQRPIQTLEHGLHHGRRHCFGGSLLQGFVHRYHHSHQYQQDLPCMYRPDILRFPA